MTKNKAGDVCGSNKMEARRVEVLPCQNARSYHNLANYRKRDMTRNPARPRRDDSITIGLGRGMAMGTAKMEALL